MKALLRLLVSAAILAFLVRKFGAAEVMSRLLASDWRWVVAGLAAFSVGQLVSSLRFVWALESLGRRIGFGESTRVHYVGLWFNQVLPTSMGGDVVKVLLLKPAYGMSRAVRATLLDRLSGYLFLAFAMALCLPLYFGHFPSPYPGWFAATVAFGTAAGVAVLVAGARSGPVRRRFPARVRGILLFILDIPRFLRGGYLWRQLGSSAVVHLSGVASFWALSTSLGVHATFVEHLLLVPLIFLVALVPVSFAGWGLRETGAIGLYGLVGIAATDALAVSLLFGFVLVLAALPGGVAWLLSPRKPGNFRSKQAAGT
ncbi:MAG: flippase-like domain-containing protein [Lysobacter sp.]|nr:flippase-like domain-containing protein [Lysobacter sp.]